MNDENDDKNNWGSQYTYKDNESGSLCLGMPFVGKNLLVTVQPHDPPMTPLKGHAPLDEYSAPSGDYMTVPFVRTMRSRIFNGRRVVWFGMEPEWGFSDRPIPPPAMRSPLSPTPTFFERVTAAWRMLMRGSEDNSC